MNDVFRLVERIFLTLWRIGRAVGGTAYHHGWEKPKSIRGWRWTVGLWCFLIPSCWLTALLFSTKRPEVLPLLLLQGGALWWIDREFHILESI